MTAPAAGIPLISRTLLKSLRWTDAGLVRQSLPPVWRNWLLDEGSLTARLMARFGADSFRVRVLATRTQQPVLSERMALALPPRFLCWTREVVLVCGGQPRVVARTLIPQHAFTGAARQLRLLGERPLGAALFRTPGIVRHPMEVAVLPALSGHAHGWARRSVFDFHGCPVLVCEFFLPACLTPPALS